MYKKYGSILLLGNCIVLAALLCVRELEFSRGNTALALWAETAELSEAYETTQYDYGGQAVSQSQRIVEYHLLERTEEKQLSAENLEALLRIVEAEAGTEGEKGKLLVANVVLNRVKSEDFPDSVREVVFQKNGQVWQFSPVGDGRYYEVTVTEETRRAVERALKGEDISDGALYFAARKYADPELMKWFDEKLEFLFSYGGHEFFK